MTAIGHRKGSIHETRADRVFTAVVYVLVILLLIIFLYPLWFVLMASVSDPTYVNSGTPLMYPRGFTMMGYSRVFSDERIWIGYVNTILYSGAGMLVATLVQVMAGYALSRKDLPGRGGKEGPGDHRKRGGRFKEQRGTLAFCKRSAVREQRRACKRRQKRTDRISDCQEGMQHGIHHTQ